MSFLHDKAMRNLFFSMFLFVFLLVSLDTIIGIKSQNEINRVLINQQALTASTLTKYDIPERIIADAVTNTEITSKGTEILNKLGITEGSDLRYMPDVLHLRNGMILNESVKIIILAAVLFSAVILFLSKRERLYQNAIDAVFDFNNCGLSLPQTDEGSIYRLFGCINNMALALKSGQETEKKTKEFLKRTVSDISHQLKTPLSALSMYNEIILGEPENAGTVMIFAQRSDTAIERIRTLILELLKITRLDAGGITFDKKKYMVKELINISIENLTERASREGKVIIIECENEEIECDLNWTGEAIGNIVKNALDHTSDNGKIYISCESTPIETRLLISDNGGGILPEDFHHIFKRFYRSKKSSDSQGIGLGLPLAKAVIEGQGGIISVESEKNMGTVFTISLSC